MQKNIGHITSENTFMMCPTFLFVILGDEAFKMSSDKFKKSQKALKIKELFARLFDCNGNGPIEGE